MLIQQLRQMVADGIVTRIVHHQVPPKVEYGLTAWEQSLSQPWTRCWSGLSGAISDSERGGARGPLALTQRPLAYIPI